MNQTLKIWQENDAPYPRLIYWIALSISQGKKDGMSSKSGTWLLLSKYHYKPLITHLHFFTLLWYHLEALSAMFPLSSIQYIVFSFQRIEITALKRGLLDVRYNYSVKEIAHFNMKQAQKGRKRRGNIWKSWMW